MGLLDMKNGSPPSTTAPQKAPAASGGAPGATPPRRFGIDRAIQLMRSLPTDQNPELVATVIAFLARDTMGATALGLFSTSWLTFGVALLTAKPGATSHTLASIPVFSEQTAAVCDASACCTGPTVRGKPVGIPVKQASSCC